MNKRFSTAWIKLPVELLKNPKVSAIEANIYSVMLDKADQTLTVRISYNELADATGVSKNTVILAIKKLTAGKWIWSDETKAKSYDKTTYHLTEIIPSKNKKKTYKDQW